MTETQATYKTKNQQEDNSPSRCLQTQVSSARLLPILNKCDFCGKEFLIKNHMTHQRFCSAECRKLRYKKNQEHKCLLCGIVLNRKKDFCTDCAKSIRRIKALIIYYNNPERMRMSTANWRKKHPIKFKRIWKKYQPEYKKRERISLSDNYIKSLICIESKWIIKHKDIPPELIEAKRQNMIINRKLKESNNGI